MAFQIVSDVASDIGEEILREFPEIVFVPMQVSFGEDTRTYGPGGDLEIGEFYQRLRGGAFPVTAPISPIVYRRVFEQVLMEEKDVLYLGLSGGLSASFQAASLAASMLRELYPHRRIVTVETACASVGLALLVHGAAERQQEGMDLDALVSWVEENRLHVCHWFTVEAFDHLKHGGRVSGAEAAIGTLLGIRPLLCMGEDGTLKVMEKPRGSRRSMLRQVACMNGNWMKEMGRQVLISHADDEEAARKLKQAVLEAHPDADVRTVCAGPVIGTHTGPGMLCLVFWGRKRQLGLPEN